MRLLILLLVSFSAYASAFGGQDGGGGHVVACYKDASHQTLQSVELYDLWEQNQLNRLNYLSFKNLQEAYSFVFGELTKIENSSFANSWYARHFSKDASQLFEELTNAQNGNESKNQIVRFIGDNSKLKIISDIENFIEPKDDRCIIQAMGN